MEYALSYSYYNWYDQLSFLMEKKGDHDVELNWKTGDVNDIHFWNNKYYHPEEYVMYK